MSYYLTLVVKRHHQNVKMMSVLFKKADVNTGYLKVKLALSKNWHPNHARKRIQHAFVDWKDKSVPQVTVWHHSAEPRDPRDRIVYPILKLMIYSYILHPYPPYLIKMIII